MILSFDTYYSQGSAKTVCLAFEHWQDAVPFAMHEQMHDGIEEYVPGEFYKRELPCILGLWKTLNYDRIEAIVIDGFVYLDDERRPGLGAHLYHALQEAIPVIGVAKTNFAAIIHHKQPLMRGDSTRPLFITCAGIELAMAAECIGSMHGSYRIPTLLKLLDKKTKE
ncbi:MAG: endonuclease V [Flavobacteriales bacterium]|nr:endonuclease V [Flavobacteriales bacterium]